MDDVKFACRKQDWATCQMQTAAKVAEVAIPTPSTNSQATWQVVHREILRSAANLPETPKLQPFLPARSVKIMDAMRPPFEAFLIAVKPTKFGVHLSTTVFVWGNQR